MYVYEAVYVLLSSYRIEWLARENCIQMSVFEKIGKEVFNNDVLRLLKVPLF
jgi:hypothetical protein